MNVLIPMVTEKDGIPITTSRVLADQFGKQHKNIIRDIENTINQLKIEPITAEFAEKNFILSEGTDQRNRQQPMYLMTKDGFTLLAMGFTGAKAMQFKVAYINAFNRMERLIRGDITATALQSRQEQPQALESTIANSFLQAISEAVTNGNYCILPKEKRIPGATERYKEAAKGKEILGIYDDYYITLKSLPAYKIYRSASKSKTDIKALYIMLENTGIIIPRKGYKQRKIGDKICTAIDIVTANAEPLVRYLKTRGE